ncbi:MAG: hypothetical protein NTV49_01300 [Kiritimatiellaeota bacterium]|nr:hypothetical protein [Kiritimatiellota bacterium]
MNIKGCRGFDRPGRSGQAMVEYVVATGLLLGTLAMLALVLYTFREYGGRVLDMVAFDYP